MGILLDKPGANAHNPGWHLLPKGALRAADNRPGPYHRSNARTAPMHGRDSSLGVLGFLKPISYAFPGDFACGDSARILQPAECQGGPIESG
jgi:hypothetical protein